MKENEAKFIGEFFNLISKYNVTFSGTEEPTLIFVNGIYIGEIVEKNTTTSININVSEE